MAAAFLVLQNPPRPLWKSFPRLAWGSLLASLQPGSVHAEMVTMKLPKHETR